MRIEPGGLDDPKVAALLALHLAAARAATAAGSAHALDLDGLRAPGIRFWTLRDGDEPIATGALKRLPPDGGEVKSMFVAVRARRGGAGAAMLRHIVEAARRDGLRRLSLETGSWAYFAPARALYAAAGFVPCGPFGSYGPDPNSAFMTLELDAPPAPKGVARRP